MIKIGNVIFRYRNGLFPLFYLLLFFRSKPLLPDFQIAAFIGVIVAILGQGIRFLTIGLDYIIRGGRNRRVYAEDLVTGGVFAHCRNPLYVGNFLLLLGVGFASNSQLYFYVAIPFFIFAYAAIIAAEENFLRNKFGQQFEDYCSRVNRVVPSFSGLNKTLTGMEFNWRRVMVKEYGTTFIWMAALLLVLMKNVWAAGGFEANRRILQILGSTLALLMLTYAVIRYLKKSGLLDDSKIPTRPAPPSDQNLVAKTR